MQDEADNANQDVLKIVWGRVKAPQSDCIWRGDTSHRRMFKALQIGDWETYMSLDLVNALKVDIVNTVACPSHVASLGTDCMQGVLAACESRTLKFTESYKDAPDVEWFTEQLYKTECGHCNAPMTKPCRSRAGHVLRASFCLGRVSSPTVESINRMTADDETMMTLNEYGEIVHSTAIYQNQGSFYGLNYTALGLTGEAGEVANKLKKIMRGEYINVYLPASEVIGVESREQLKDELGDVLWYVVECAKELGFTLNDIAVHNVTKLQARKASGTLHKRDTDNA